MAYIIYLFLCSLNGFVMSTLGVNLTDWQFWVSIACIFGAWVCGREHDN